MYIKIIIHSLALIGLFVLQIAFISGLPSWFRAVNALLLALVFITGLSGLKPALYWALGLGFLMDIFSILPFGIYFICLTSTVLVVNFMAVNFFTDRSLYTFISLVLFGTAYYKAVLYTFNNLLSFINDTIIPVKIDILFWKSELIAILINIFLAWVLFVLINVMSKKFKPAFLVKRT